MRTALLSFALSAALPVFADNTLPCSLTPETRISTANEPMAVGPFEASWDSLGKYQMPEWFRDAKFGIWAHWGPQCQPEAGDWYARHLYVEGSREYTLHVERYGHPSQVGFKDIIHAWKAEHWDPRRLVAFYRKVGARYFFAMANHHDNFDLWNSRHQTWNAVRLGPEKDLVRGWAEAARSEGLPFGVSVHAAHAWSWYETAQGADKQGPKAGVPYDGKLRTADGRGTWWEGLDPQDLYAQNHTPSPGYENARSIHGRWNWGNGVTQPDAAYCQRFYDRTADLINQVKPDLIYFDDTALPLWPVSDAGLRIAAHFYNSHLARTGNAGVLFGKVLTEEQRKCLSWDIERGVPATSLPDAWQTDTCLGDWHYNRSVYDHSGYKSARTVIHMLADIVSKNGNLLLNVPVRADGTIDEKEEAILKEIGSWMDTNHEAIYATRPWKVFGEGPASAGAVLDAQGFNEGKGKPFTAGDVRYTVSKDGHTLYIIILGVPTTPLRLTQLGRTASGRHLSSLQALGCKDAPKWTQTDEALNIEPLPLHSDSPALVLKASL